MTGTPRRIRHNRAVGQRVDADRQQRAEVGEAFEHGQVGPAEFTGLLDVQARQ
jgi:hypothetical protein